MKRRDCLWHWQQHKQKTHDTFVTWIKKINRPRKRTGLPVSVVFFCCNLAYICSPCGGAEAAARRPPIHVCVTCRLTCQHTRGRAPFKSARRVHVYLHVLFGLWCKCSAAFFAVLRHVPAYNAMLARVSSRITLKRPRLWSGNGGAIAIDMCAWTKHTQKMHVWRKKKLEDGRIGRGMLVWTVLLCGRLANGITSQGIFLVCVGIL